MIPDIDTRCPSHKLITIVCCYWQWCVNKLIEEIHNILNMFLTSFDQLQLKKRQVWLFGSSERMEVWQINHLADTPAPETYQHNRNRFLTCQTWVTQDFTSDKIISGHALYPPVKLWVTSLRLYNRSHVEFQPYWTPHDWWQALSTSFFEESKAWNISLGRILLLVISAQTCSVKPLIKEQLRVPNWWSILSQVTPAGFQGLKKWKRLWEG